jgi:hypothetical protein
MAAWDELKVVLVRLRDEQPGVLMHYPMPEVDEGRVPPFGIHLAPWAATTAEELHRQFGDDVELTVGALPYPPGRQLHLGHSRLAVTQEIYTHENRQAQHDALAKLGDTLRNEGQATP